MAAQSVSETLSAALNALNSLSIADSNTATSNIATSNIISTATTDMHLPNFPLPRELRDHIYGYLLDGDYLRVPRKFDQVPQGDTQAGPKAYHFHTNILAVNREIHHEAELLYKKNIFVVVSYQRPTLEQRREEVLWVPIVSKEHVNRMKQHSLRIHTDPGPSVIQKYALSTGTEIPVQSYIILARDIKVFAVSVHVSEENSSGAGIVIVALPNKEPQVRLAGGDEHGLFYESTRLKCQLRNTRYHTMDRALQNYLLAPLDSIIRMSKRVSFTGVISDPEQTAYLKQVMGPSLVCQDALFWSAYRECVLAKDAADAAVDYDELDFSVQLYRKIASRLGARLLPLTRVDRDIYKTESPFAEILQVAETFAVEVLAILAMGELKLGHIDYFLGIYRELHQRLCLWDDIDFGPLDKKSTLLHPELFDIFHSLSSYFYLYAPHPGKPALSIAWFIESFHLKGADSHSLPYLSHDREILERRPDQRARMSAECLPFDQCAAVCLPFKPTSFYKSVEGLVQTGQFKGWHNLDYLRSVDDDLKQDILNIQSEYGLQQTDFSRL
ncbi:hypothetical protein Q7P36_004473 [Cladosporium allicinum]